MFSFLSLQEFQRCPLTYLLALCDKYRENPQHLLKITFWRQGSGRTEIILNDNNFIVLELLKCGAGRRIRSWTMEHNFW